MQGYRVLDLNIFYRESWDAETRTTSWSDTFTIDPYIYESDWNGTRKYDTDVLIECDAFETQWLAEQFPADEYGDDFWIFAEEVQMPSRRIARILQGIQIDQNKQAASIVITDSSTM
jgi:hypothetical protein